MGANKRQMLDKSKAYDGQAITEVYCGGVHPKMDLNFSTLLEKIKTHRPDLHIKAFTAVELDYMFARREDDRRRNEIFNSKGLNSIPGGGAEIFDEQTRLEIAGDKCSSEIWLGIKKQRINKASK